MVSFKLLPVFCLTALASAQLETLIRPTILYPTKTVTVTITPKPTPTPTTTCDPPNMNTLCPRLCVVTETLPAPKELCPKSYQYCPPATTQTSYASCSWCPVARCATMHTDYTVSACPAPATCEPVKTVTKKCTVTEWPDNAIY